MTADENIALANLMWENLVCFDEPERINLQNDKDGLNGISLNLEFKYCKDHPDCYSEEIIR